MASNNKQYNLYRIVNTNPGKKQNKKYFVVSSVKDEDKLRRIIRGMATSSTAKGGIKSVANDMKSSGKEYKDNFTVSTIIKGTTKERATELRNKLKAKANPAKVYNEPRS